MQLVILKELMRFNLKKGVFSQVVTAFQYKFYPSKLTSNQKNEIISSLRNAQEKFKFMDNWIVVTPEDWIKQDMDWFEKLKHKFETTSWVESNGIHRRLNFEINHWGHTQIIELALKHPHVGRYYFSELYKDSGGQLNLVSFQIDEENTNWNKSQYATNRYFQSSKHSNEDYSSDPVFDVQILNNTEDTILFQSVEFIQEKVWSTLKGIPEEFRLKSVGTVFLDIDFDKVTTTEEFEGPIVLKPKSPFRFKIQLRDFTSKAPGNWAQFSFKSNFNNGRELLTKSYILGF